MSLYDSDAIGDYTLLQAGNMDFESPEPLLTVLSINFVGDGLRDALDPRSDKKV